MGSCSKGRRQLLLILTSTTRTELAPKCGLTRAAIGYYAAGDRTPVSFAVRLRLRKALGIPEGDWDVPANDVEPLTQQPLQKVAQ